MASDHLKYTLTERSSQELSATRPDGRRQMFELLLHAIMQTERSQFL